MRIDLTDMLYALSFAIDKVEQELVGVATGHGKRVAYLSALMGKAYGISGEELVDFAGCAILHDNALTEFIREELNNDTDAFKEGNHTQSGDLHCVTGEENICLLPFRTDVHNVILYHHENADGSGMMGKRTEEIPVKAQILHLADILDMGWPLDQIGEGEFQEMSERVREETGVLFSEKSVQMFQESIDYACIAKMQREGVDACLRALIPSQYEEYTDEEIHHLAALFARIVDYKSSFTRKHSMGVAEKAEIMARYYRYSDEKITRYYLAAALHDIGKLVVHNDILEKPGRLDAEEFRQIKDHAMATYRILQQVKGMEDITAWAGHHHEKLDGSGYPFGLKAEDLSQEERLLACIDIYQALTEARPYKDGMSHEEAVGIMREMADQGQIDAELVEDMDHCMKEI